jgi:hypothetical protein
METGILLDFMIASSERPPNRRTNGGSTQRSGSESAPVKQQDRHASRTID